MTEKEARSIMRQHGWTYLLRSPKGVAKYVYAVQKRKGVYTNRYICPLARLEILTESELVEKLAQGPAQNP
jgi:hypothetical protein